MKRAQPCPCRAAPTFAPRARETSDKPTERRRWRRRPRVYGSSPDETNGGASPARIDPRTGYAGLGPGFNGARTPTKEGSVKVLGVDLSVHEDGDSEDGEFSDDSAAATVEVKAADAAVVGSIPRRGERAVASRVFAVVAEPDVALHFLLFLVMGASMAVTDSFLFLWLEELGGSKFLMGLALMFTCLSEVVVFAKEAAIKRALSTEWCVALVLFCYGVRQVFYASLGDGRRRGSSSRSSCCTA